MDKEEFLVLNMPFDEAAGSAKAYDYSSNRADGTLSSEGAEFVAGKQGNCMQFNGKGFVEVEKSVLNLSLPFSMCAYIKASNVARTFMLVFNYNGLNRFYQYEVSLVEEVWYYIVVTHENGVICTYLNGTMVKRDVIPTEWGNPIGVSLNQANYNTELGNGCVDECKLYQCAFTQDEVQDLLDDTKQLAYLLDGVDFKKFGVFVSKSKGLMDALKQKEPAKVEFSGYHGVAVDLSRPRFDEREIQLECFMHVTGGKMAFVQAVKNFVEQFTAKHKVPAGMESAACPAGLHRLTVDIHPTKPLLYEVYLPEGVEVDKTWNDKRMVGTFTLRLREPEPVKMVLKHLRVNDNTRQVQVTLTTSKLVNIYWGDGTQMQDVYGDNITITHDYQQNGDYFIVITGVIEEVTNVQTNAIIVWEKL